MNMTQDTNEPSGASGGSVANQTDILVDALWYLKGYAAERYGMSTHYDGCHRAHNGCLVRKLAIEVERLRGIVDGMEAAIETAGFIYRNTDSGPNLVRPR
jgi:hypothetical protein